jgi:hypothetical protein
MTGRGMRAGRLGLIAVTVGAISLSTTAVEAASVTYTTTTESLMQAGSIPQFDPALGLLTEVDVRATGVGFAEFVYFSTPAPATVSYTFLGRMDFIFGNLTLEGVGSRTYAIPPFTSGFILMGDFATSTTLTQASQLAPFYGKGQIGVGISMFFTLVDAPPLVVPVPTNHASTGASGTATVTYEYIPGAMPEPSSSTLAVIGLVMLAAASNRLVRG